MDIILNDRDRWAIEAEWYDGTLERVMTFEDHATAAYWIAEHSESWFQVQRFLFAARSIRS
jgi:hypothetical protein